MYTQKIQSCHQDFQIRKVSCGLRSKTIVTHRNFRQDSGRSVCDLGESRRLCAISDSSSQSRRSFRASFVHGLEGFREWRFVSSKVRSSPREGTCNGPRSRPSARAAEREGGPSLSANGVGRRAASVSRPSARDLTAVGRARARAVPGSAHEA